MTTATPPFVPADFEPPAGLDTPEFRLRPLTPAVVDLDYDALMSSVDLIRAMFGRNWPTHDFTRAENLADLEEHAEECARREAFAYTVLSPDERTCLGCVYFNPPRGHPVDVRVYLWVRQSASDQGLDPVLFRTVKQWLAEAWPWRTVVFPGRAEDGSWTPLEGRLV